MDSNLFYLTRKMEKMEHSEIKHTLDWKIPDFMWLLENQTNREIRTEKPDKEGNNKECFQLKILFVGHENNLVEIYYKTHKSVIVKTTLNMLPRYYNGGHYITSTTLLSDRPYQQIQNNKWQFLKGLLKSELINDYQVTNGMELRFEFLISRHSDNLTKELPCLPANEKKEFDLSDCNLIDDLTNLLMNTTFSDVTVKSVEGDEFPAHKNFLATRSAVFKAHFEHNTVESKTNVIEFPFETDVLKNVLTYIYTDDAPNIDELARTLLEAAEFYQLTGLKKRCVKALEKNLTVENAIEILELANLYRVTYLKRKTLEFIKDGLAGDVFETKGWNTTQSVEVVKSVYGCIVKNKIV